MSTLQIYDYILCMKLDIAFINYNTITNITIRDNVEMIIIMLVINRIHIDGEAQYDFLQSMASMNSFNL